MALLACFSLRCSLLIFFSPHPTDMCKNVLLLLLMILVVMLLFAASAADDDGCDVLFAVLLIMTMLLFSVPHLRFPLAGIWCSLNCVSLTLIFPTVSCRYPRPFVQPCRLHGYSIHISSHSNLNMLLVYPVSLQMFRTGVRKVHNSLFREFPQNPAPDAPQWLDLLNRQLNNERVFFCVLRHIIVIKT